MKKIYYVVLCILLLFITGCKKSNEKISLDKKYYNTGEFINVNSEEVSKLDSENYILYSYNNYCAFSVPCEDIFKEFMSDLIKLNNKQNENISIEVLESNNFEEDKKRILSKLEKGEKVFIMSSYKTVGAGQNLQYKFLNKKNFVILYKKR